MKYAIYLTNTYYSHRGPDPKTELLAVPMNDANNPARLTPPFHEIEQLSKTAPESNYPPLVTQIKTMNRRTGAVRYASIVAHDQPRYDIPEAPAPIAALEEE